MTFPEVLVFGGPAGPPGVERAQARVPVLQLLLVG
ncbi:hypothetical protein FHX61_004563 [Cupriavidus alkaliphilus]|uniref:Uncharacterized protein n=1 Tax=Cupriavidus alkaliphilus TaxID=942866 RepID=A0A7W4VE13_9BURK|nr:hypothetical protein [Cupriavidus alkaliphilus]